MVAELEASPGALIRMLVMDPPKFELKKMAPMRIKAVAGGQPKVKGRSKAIPAVGPIPGKTPTMIPITVPRIRTKMFFSEKAKVMPPVIRFQ
jgi:hypothetical protein